MNSPSLNSVSATTSQSRKVKTLLKRKPKVRQTQDSDMRWLWAAYRQGMWSDEIPQELDQIAFKQCAIEMIGIADIDWILTATDGESHRPVALVMGLFVAAGRGVEVQIDWFPWATPRNKLEATVSALKMVQKQYKIFIYANDENLSFWQRVTKYRILRQGCKILDYYALGEHGMMFYTCGP